ncbi:MAG: hypothetical protein J1F04_09785 [Oscillospiraceae bacterium]|nr:hypothetical protein [Oscillospiraceae bacterium]
MAAGNGFSTSPMGFNKNEVNEYIASISKRMSELEAEKREIEKKYESVKKVVDGADDKVRIAETEAKERIEKLEEQLRTERKNSEDLVDQVDELKRKLKNAISSAGAKSSGGGAPNTAAAEKQAASIIAAAEKTAKDTVAKANRTAEEVVQKAKKTASDIMASTGGASKGVDLSGFMAQLRSFADSVNSGCKTLLSKAEELSGGEGGAAVEMPDLSSFEAPKAEAPEFDAPDMSFGSEETAEKDSSGGMDDINALLASMSGDSADNGEDMDAGFGFAAMDDIMGGASNDDSDMSGDLMGFDDLDAGLSEDEPDVPEDTSSSDETESAFDFGGDMLSGFGDDDMSFGQADDDMTGDVTSDMADAVEANDVKAGDSDLDFGGSSEMDEMQKLLEQAELTFGGGSSEFEERTADASDGAVDDWSSLQNELDALGKNDDMGMDTGMDSGADSAPANDIWSLGDMDMNESDDDMSSDLFGSF